MNTDVLPLVHSFVYLTSFVVFLTSCEIWDKFADKFGLTPLTEWAHPGYN